MKKIEKTHLISKKSFGLGESDLREERQSWWVKALERRVRLAWVAGMDQRRGSEAWISGLGVRRSGSARKASDLVSQI